MLTDIERAYELLESADDPALVISLLPVAEAIARAEAAAGSPLGGVPFVVKDNIDVEGLPTTAGCPSFAYTPSRSATVVRRLEAAGAVPIAKVNLDQFATGLVGTRSPYGTPRNPLAPGRVPGGSSSGSAVAVARGIVPFALGTDTAGSGRVPAMFTGTVGLKPTRGWLSTAGVVPAVRTLDCVSLFALDVEQAWQVARIAGSFDPDDPFSRRGALMPTQPVRIGIGGGAGVEAVEEVEAVEVVEVVEVDLDPFLAAGELLYGGPWVAERLAALGGFLSGDHDDVDPVVGSIIRGAAHWTAVDAASAAYRLAELRRRCERVWDSIDVLVVPTAPEHPTIEEVASDPLGVNARLGRYATFVNLLDLCAVAVPTGTCAGVTVIAPAWHDATAAAVASSIHVASGGIRGATGERLSGPAWHPPGSVGVGRPVVGAGPVRVELAVVGAHLVGQPLHPQLTAIGAVLMRTTRTTRDYRLYALDGTASPKPGLVRVDPGAGAAIEVEVYTVRTAELGKFVAAIPAPLSIGTIRLGDGHETLGFLCEPAGLGAAADITAFGGWRAYLAGVPEQQTLNPATG